MGAPCDLAARPVGFLGAGAAGMGVRGQPRKNFLMGTAIHQVAFCSRPQAHGALWADSGRGDMHWGVGRGGLAAGG